MIAAEYRQRGQLPRSIWPVLPPACIRPAWPIQADVDQPDSIAARDRNTPREGVQLTALTL